MRFGIMTLGLVLLTTSGMVQAQEKIVNSKLIEKGSRKQVVFEGVSYDLYDSAHVAEIGKILIEYDSLQKVIKAKDRLLSAYDTIPQICSTTVAAKNEYIASLNEMMLSYKQLYKDARKLSSSKAPFITLEGALGVSGADGFDLQKMSSPVILAGVGIRRFKIYSMLQEHNVGLLIGRSFGLF